MKQLFVFLILAFIVLAGCKPNSTPGSRSWSKEYKEKITEKLKNDALQKNMSNIPGFLDCAVNKLETNFPDENVNWSSDSWVDFVRNCEYEK